MDEKEFKILSIDGGGIRGIYPSQILAEVEAQLQQERSEEIKIYDYFDLICGTSTGGILSIALSLGMLASQLTELFVGNAKKIFGPRRPFRTNIFFPRHNSMTLESILKKEFKELFSGKDSLLGDCKTRVCIPVYDSFNGRLNVLKTSHHEKLLRDWQIPAYQAAMATAAAPTFFNPYTLKYKGITGQQVSQHNKVDGGICVNNPVMVGFIEAVHGLNIPMQNIKILSIGTGINQFSISKKNVGWGIAKWMLGNRLIELIMQSQSNVVDNQIKLINEGIGQGGDRSFDIYRIQHIFTSKKESIKLDEFRKDKLDRLIIAAQESFKHEGKMIIDNFFQNKVEQYKPFHYGKL